MANILRVQKLNILKVQMQFENNDIEKTTFQWNIGALAITLGSKYHGWANNFPFSTSHPVFRCYAIYVSK
jgi:hypothetical protein